jgi:sterol desaturase/sphingolipid hydroxylase (fatty acid hydroxylase superfamily)
MIERAFQLIVLMALFSLVETCWPAARGHRWWRRPFLVDLCGWLVQPVAVGAGIALAGAVVGAALPAAPISARASVASWPRWTQLLAATIVADFCAYWIHRAYHRFPFLWSFHVVHHSSEELDWLSTSRLHPVSQMADAALVAALLLFCGFPVAIVAGANVFIGAAALAVHANVPWNLGLLRHLFVSPVFHQWHHARTDAAGAAHLGNYGALLSLWDRLFGTWTLPSATRPPRFGAEDSPPATLGGLFFHPLRRIAREWPRASNPPVDAAPSDVWADADDSGL